MKLLKYLEPDNGQELPWLLEDDTAEKLWERVNKTWGQIKQLIKNDTLLDGRIEAMEAKLSIT